MSRDFPRCLFEHSGSMSWSLMTSLDVTGIRYVLITGVGGGTTLEKRRN